MDKEFRKEVHSHIEDKDNYKTHNLSKDGGEDKVDFDKLLSSAGEFGLYQFLLSLGTFPFYTFGVFVYYSQMFMTEVSPNHWCWIPELANLSDTERRNLAIPKDDTEQFGYSQCFSYAANWTEVITTDIRPNKTWSTMPCQYGWEFNKTEIPYPTISSELGWVCNKSSYQANAQAIFFSGSVFGGLLFGYIADKYGRLPVIIGSNMIGCAAGLISSFARNFAEFATCRFFMGMAYDSCMMIMYLLVLEYIAPKYKTLISNSSFGIFYSAIVTILPWIALACGHWKIISLVTSVPLVLGIIIPFFLPESPRWLLSKGRVDDAVAKILMIGRINKKEIPPKLIEQLKVSASQETQQKSHNCLEIFKRPVMRNIFILICLEFMCCTIVFDGLVRSIGQLDFDFFLSFSIISFTELPSMLLLAFILDWMGRRWLTIVCMAFSCVFCILTQFVGSGLPSVVCAVLARFAVNMSYAANLQWAAELLPTTVRGSGVSIVHIFGYVATVLSPYIIYLNTYIYWLPLVILGVVAGTGAVLAFWIPETANKDMPHTFEDAEEMSKMQKMWDIPCIRRTKTNVNMNNIDGHVNDSFEM